MKTKKENGRFFLPDGNGDVSRVTHLGVGAHQDDLEFMAFEGILGCYESGDKWFGGVTCTDGGGSARTGRFGGFTDEEMKVVRVEEQERAAEIGRYGVMWQLGYASSEIKVPGGGLLVDDLEAVLRATRPEVVYTHSLADKHDTHVAVTLALLAAARRLPAGERPGRVTGCEVWRDLDWMPDGEKVAMEVSGNDGLASELNGVFESQIAGGKRYDLAVMGRRRANATFFNSHATDASDAMWFGMDLTPLVEDDGVDPAGYVLGVIDRFRADVGGRVESFSG
ncbi:MAG: PIG-L family deacetylase [Verrucomicrobiales bacterium]|nr:PIG-L family deacetylase [Verrucomicrobiales bacterium]